MHILKSIVLAAAIFGAAQQSPASAQNTVANPANTPLRNEPVLTVDPSANPVVDVPPSAVAPASPPVVKAPPRPVAAAKKKGPVDALKPGEYVWEKHDNYEGKLKIVAVLDIQRIYIFKDDSLIAFSTISTGKAGKSTPTGRFTILQKNVDHKSNIYSNAPMPFMQRLTWDGIAMHAGKIPGYPASHGCIRLPLGFAKALYGITKFDQEVVVLQDTLSPAPPAITIEPPKPPPVQQVPAIDPVTVATPTKV
jgi:lipoprotein-anchoring transpeptidase ErfK/SrfK